MMRGRAFPLFRVAAVATMFLLLLAPEWPAFGDTGYRFQTLVGRELRFDYVSWTTNALLDKGRALLAGAQHNLTEEDRRTFVQDYLAQIVAAQQAEAAIERAYVDPAVADPALATDGLAADAQTLRDAIARQQPLAEAIVQEQVADLLAGEGLAIGGAAWPPVMMTMSPIPYMLIVSPRDRIAQINSASLVPGLTTEARDALETAIYGQLDQSALVVPIGGLGIYPAMIRETGNINWLAEVTAHEWAHHWLSLHPLGVRYMAEPRMRTINETVASLVGQEIGPLVIARYYPEFVPPPMTMTPPSTAGVEPPAFDFSAEMAATRATVDRLLATGEIDAAESYMEQRRQLFVANGYAIRKLNQAYFAFYGGYAAEPGGAAGADPVGPLLRGLRAASPSLETFLRDVGGITSYDDLVALYRLRVGEEPTLN